MRPDAEREQDAATGRTAIGTDGAHAGLGRPPLPHRLPAVARLLLGDHEEHPDTDLETPIRDHWQQTALDLARADGLDDSADPIEARDEADTAQVRGLDL